MRWLSQAVRVALSTLAVIEEAGGKQRQYHNALLGVVTSDVL